MPKKVKTVEEFVDLVGGVHGVAHAFECSPNAVYNWIAANEFPAAYYKAANGLLIMTCGRYARLDDALFPMKRLVNVPRTRGAHGRFVAPTLTLVPKVVPPDVWAELEAWERGPQTAPLDYGWLDKHGAPVPAAMQIALTKDFIAQQRGQY
jgi:hypothetical protein